MGNGLVPASPRSEAPRSRPNHNRLPVVALTGPSQILRTALASAGVRHVAGSLPGLQIDSVGSYLHFLGSLITPSATPSSASQAAIAALVTAFIFAVLIGPPSSCRIMICGHSSDEMKRSQLIAGEAITSPSYSSGKRCTAINPCRPPVEQPFQDRKSTRLNSS